MKSRSNSHYGSYSKNRYYDDIKTERNKPTAKQKKFFAGLCAMCHENGIDPGVGHPMRIWCDYSSGINLLLERLQAAGVDVHGNGKQFTKSVEIGTDDRGKDYVSQSMKEDGHGEE